MTTGPKCQRPRTTARGSEEPVPFAEVCGKPSLPLRALCGMHRKRRQEPPVRRSAMWNAPYMALPSARLELHGLPGLAVHHGADNCTRDQSHRAEDRWQKYITNGAVVLTPASLIRAP